MSKFVTLMLVHVVVGVMVYLLIQTIRGGYANTTYDVNRKSWLRPWLMPGLLAKRENWIRYQKAMAWIALPLLVVIYGSILWKVLCEP